MTLAAGCVGLFAAMSPLIAAADEDRPCVSGAVLELGGVWAHHGRGRGHRCDGDDISFGAVSGDQREDDLSIAQFGDPRALVLPHAGGGPLDDQNTVPLVVIFGSIVAVTGGYLGMRRVRGS